MYPCCQVSVRRGRLLIFNYVCVLNIQVFHFKSHVLAFNLNLGNVLNLLLITSIVLVELITMVGIEAPEQMMVQF